eukprot:TRINITY_DN47650_c0_g1_i1.p1 TRINITY_DN47650_c0_g1~~TRINITY_DN47650_c0_g1_i1.p1  ORF type:complete len:1215 (+),score=267.07 TRINITY_DN47650_c0_g1_i1:79-3645(+)
MQDCRQASVATSALRTPAYRLDFSEAATSLHDSLPCFGLSPRSLSLSPSPAEHSPSPRRPARGPGGADQLELRVRQLSDIAALQHRLVEQLQECANLQSSTSRPTDDSSRWKKELADLHRRSRRRRDRVLREVELFCARCKGEETGSLSRLSKCEAAAAEVRRSLDAARARRSEHLREVHAAEVLLAEAETAATQKRREADEIEEQVRQVRDAERSAKRQSERLYQGLSNFRAPSRMDSWVTDDEAAGAEEALAAVASQLQEVQQQSKSDQSEWSAEKGTLEYELRSLMEHVEASAARVAPSAELREVAPDLGTVAARLAARDEACHCARRTVDALLCRLSALTEEEVLRGAARRTELRRLRSLADDFENFARSTGALPASAERAGEADRVVVAALPDPCAVGEPLHLVATLTDSAGRVVRGAAAVDLVVHPLCCLAEGAASIGAALAVEPAAAGEGGCGGGAACCTFSACFRPSAPGRAGFRVRLGAADYVATAAVVAPEALPDTTAAPWPPPFSVSCGPDGLVGSGAMSVTVVMREPGTLFPACTPFTAVQAGELRGAPSGAAGGAEPPEFVQVGRSPIFTASVRITDGGAAAAFAEGEHPYAGCRVAVGGDEIAGSTRFAAAGDAQCDPLAVTASCFPDPCRAGDEVSVFIVLRDAARRPLPATAAGAALLRLCPTGCVEALSQQAEPHGWLYRAAFTAAAPPDDRPGRAGVDVALSHGAEGGPAVPSCRVTAEVIPPGTRAPQCTALALDPPTAAGPGDVVQVLVTTRCAAGHETPGPEPTSLRLIPLGAVGAVSAVRRRQGSEARYTAKFEVSTSAAEGDSAGVTLSFDGHAVSAVVTVVAGPTRPSGGQGQWSGLAQPDPALPGLLVTFAADPAPPGSVVDVVIACPDAGTAGGALPTLRAEANVSDIVRQPLPARGVPGVWLGSVRVGLQERCAVVSALAPGAAPTCASTTVSGEEAVLSPPSLAARLRDAAAALNEAPRDAWRRGAMERLQRCAARQRVLDERALQREAAGGYASPQSPVASTVVPGVLPLQEHILCGFGLSDGVRYGQSIRMDGGAWVHDVFSAGPAERAGVQPGDVITGARVEGGRARVAVQSVHDFRKLLSLLRIGTAPGDEWPGIHISLQRGGRTLRAFIEPQVVGKAPSRCYRVRHPPRSVSPSRPSPRASPRASPRTDGPARPL